MSDTTTSTVLTDEESARWIRILANLPYGAGGWRTSPTGLPQPVKFEDIEESLDLVKKLLQRLAAEIDEKDAKIRRYETQRRVIGEFLADVQATTHAAQDV